ncbi:hypothetical protein QUA86_11080 [Microcoleus sp. F6_B6]
MLVIAVSYRKSSATDFVTDVTDGWMDGRRKMEDGRWKMEEKKLNHCLRAG